MKRLVLVIALLACAAAAFAQNAYTLVLGVGNAGHGRGYRYYAATNCPTADPCLTYCELFKRYKCESCDYQPKKFYECVVAMMRNAKTIIFLVDRPGGRFVAADECGPAQPCGSSSYTRLELWILRHCDVFYSRTQWRRHDNRVVRMSFSGDGSACPY